MVKSVSLQDSSMNSDVYLNLVRLGSFCREFGVVYLLDATTTQAMCELSGESGMNFEELTSRLKIVNHGATALGLEKYFRIY